MTAPPPPNARGRWWAAALFWMALIFLGSLSYLSGAHTGTFLERLAATFHWRLTWTEAHEVNFLLRKAGHLTEYAVLAALLHAALRRTVGFRWRAATAAAAFALSVLYAQGDEYHQKFVPGRASEFRDVEIDAVGALLGLALTWRLPRRYRTLEK